LQGLVWLLAGFMASWEPMSEARSTTQEELEVVNIMWWIANISSTFWVISGSSTAVRTGWKGNLYDRRNIQRGLPCGAWFILRQRMQRSLLKCHESFNKYTNIAVTEAECSSPPKLQSHIGYDIISFPVLATLTPTTLRYFI
jgi:hypothetical protein